MKTYVTMERDNLMNPDDIITMTFCIVGCQKEELIKKGIKNAMQAHEILNTKIVSDLKGQAWYEPCDKPQNSITALSENEDWIDTMNTQKKIRFQVEQGEWMRVFVQPEGNDMRILVMTHHLAGAFENMKWKKQ